MKPVNKTDVATLSSRFATFGDVLKASLEDLRACPGLGDRKRAARVVPEASFDSVRARRRRRGSVPRRCREGAGGGAAGSRI